MSALTNAEPEIREKLKEEVVARTQKEPPYRVLIHNDEVTPYDFVVVVLRDIFLLPTLAAELVTYTAHVGGIALVTVLPKNEAEKRVGKAHFAASLEGYPLTFSIEPE